MSEQNTNVSGRGGITDDAVGSAADVAKQGITALTPAHSGWIFGFVLVVLIIVGSDMYVSIQTLKQTASRAEATQKYFELVEANRAQQFSTASQQWADQSRRYQEVIRALTESVARDSERAGQAAVSAIDEASRQQFIRGTQENNE